MGHVYAIWEYNMSSEQTPEQEKIEATINSIEKYYNI